VTVWSVRPEAPEDFAAIREIHLSAFAPSQVEADLVEALRASHAHVPELCLAALDDGVVVGHIAFSRGRVDGGPEVLALAPMAVAPERQREGAGGSLIREALRRAAETGFGLVVVVGHPAYYPRFGFEPAEPLGLRAPFAIAPEAWMVHRLPAYEAETRGTVVYPEAFADLT
jgi:predicted N-acetyltransferase YhbS